jgi:hypothetical protein
VGLEDADIVFVSVMEVESKGRKPCSLVKTVNVIAPLNFQENSLRSGGGGVVKSTYKNLNLQYQYKLYIETVIL